MTTLKNLKGTAIQFLDADPVVYAGAWSSGGALNTAREIAGGAGTQTSALAVGGNSPANAAFAITEEYNGSAWTEVADLNSGRNSVGSFGANAEAAIAFGGRDPGATRAYTESWNGSAWTEVNDMNQARFAFAGPGVGTSTSGMAVAGSPGDTLVETWDGTNWTEVAEINTRRTQGGAAGAANTAAIAFGGYDDGASDYTANAEVWNGSAWTEVNNLNTARSSNTGSGTSTAALCMTGRGPSPTAWARTESWNGTSWTEVADLAQARFDGASANSSPNTTSIMFGGKNPPSTYFAITEEWSFPPVTATTLNEGDMWFNSSSSALKGYGTAAGIPAATWASGGSLNSPRGNAGASGLQTAALYFGGDGPPGTIAITEQYNGTSWTEVGDLNVARSQQFFSNQGTQTAALSATGNPVATNVESWNGSSWTETTDLNTGRRNGASFGTQGAMLGTGGYYGTTYATLTEQWNGSSWTEVANCPDPKFISRGGGGTTTAGIIAGSYPNGDVDSSQLWDGSSWTNGPNINTGRSGIAFSATSQSSALAHGGGVGAPQAASALCEFYNGTSWSELNDMAQGSQSGGGAGSSVAGIHMGGYGPGALTTTEEWTASAVVSTVTTS